MAHKFGPREARASLFVRGVPFHIRRSQLEQVFAHHGEIRDVYIPLDYYTREPRGFAYVEFEDERDARYALKELDGARLWGQTIHIEWAKSDRKTPKEMRKQTTTETGPRPRAGHSDRRGRGYERDHHRGMGGGGYRGGPPASYHGGGEHMRGGRYGSYSRSPSRDRDRGRAIRRRSRRSRSSSSSSFSSSYSDKKMKGNTIGNGAVSSTAKGARRGGRARNRSYSRSSYDSSRSRSRSRSFSSGSISSRSRSSSSESIKRKSNPQSGTTVTDLSTAVHAMPIQPDLPIAIDGNVQADVVVSKKRKHKKKHKHKRRHHRRHRHADGSRRHKHKHRHKKRRKGTKVNEEATETMSGNNAVNGMTLLTATETIVPVNMESTMNTVQ